MSGELFYSGQQLSLYVMHSSIVIYGTKKVYAVQVYGTSTCIPWPRQEWGVGGQSVVGSLITHSLKGR